MIITKTPMRVSFLGGGTDYPAWYEKHGGAALSTTIDKYTYISLRWLPPFFEHKHRVVWSHIENVAAVEEIRHPAVRACLTYMGIEEGISVVHDGDLPARTGMGTSSTFIVGLLNGLHALKGEFPQPSALAQEASRIERDWVKNVVGDQDQMAAAVGGLNLYEFRREGTTCHKVKLARQDDFEAHMMLVFSGFNRNASEVAASYHFDDVKTLKAMQKLAYAGMQAIEREDWDAFGHILDSSWKLKCRLSPQICPPYISYLYERARAAGALGGKLLGAGGNGFMLFWCDPDKQPAVRGALQGMLFVPFHVEHKGSRVLLNGVV